MVVSMKEFLESPEYLGDIFRFDPLFGFIKDKLIELYDDKYDEVVFQGAPGSGKTTFGMIILAYELYLLSVMDNISLELNLSEDTEIFFKVKTNMHNNIYRNDIKLLFSYSPKLKGLINLDALKMGGSGEVLPNVFMAFEDKRTGFDPLGRCVYFQLNDTLSDRIDTTDSEKELNVYRSVVSRIESRFMTTSGIAKGKSVLLSQDVEPESLICRSLDDIEGNTKGKYILRNVPVWKARKEKLDLSGETFTLELPKNDGTVQVLEIPIEFKPQFDINRKLALSDAACIYEER